MITDNLTTNESSNIITSGIGHVSLTAEQGIGSSVNDINTTIETIEALNLGTGGIYVTETDGLTIAIGGVTVLAEDGGDVEIVVVLGDTITIDGHTVGISDDNVAGIPIDCGQVSNRHIDFIRLGADSGAGIKC